MKDTEWQLTDLLAVQTDLKSKARSAGLRAENAVALVDHAFTHQSLPCARSSAISASRTPEPTGWSGNSSPPACSGSTTAVYDREFTAPDVLAVLLR